MMNDSDQLGLELLIHAEDADDIVQAPRPAPPVLMWAPRAALELAAAAACSHSASSPAVTVVTASIFTACPLLLVSVGEKAALFVSLLVAANAEWHTEAVATLVIPHAPLTGCAGYATTDAMLAPHASSTNTLYRVSRRRGAPGGFLHWCVQQVPQLSNAPSSTRAEDSAQLAEALVGALPSVPLKTLVLDTFVAAHFQRDSAHASDNSVDGQTGAMRGVCRVLDSHTAAVASVSGADVSPHPTFLSSSNMIESTSAALLAALQMRAAWCRVVVAVDRESDPCESIVALADASAHLVVPLLAEAFGRDSALSPAKLDAAASCVHGVLPASVGTHLRVRHWLAMRAKRAHPHPHV